MREGWSYIVTHAPVATILGINILWATGGGAMNLIADRLGALVFAGENGISPDSAVAAFYFAGGFGLFIGMMIARRVGAFFRAEKTDRCVHRLEPVYSGHFLRAGGRDADAGVGVCLGGYLARVVWAPSLQSRKRF